MSNRNLVVIGISTGGPTTLRELFGELPPLNAAIVVVLHITPEMDFRIAQGLDASAAMPVFLARDGDFLKAGCVYLAPGGVHLQLDGNHRISLREGARVNYVQPSVDVAMLSLTRPAQGKLVGVIMTGMGKDGAEGLRHVKKIGGTTIAQDQDSCVIFGMPKAALATGAVDYVLPPRAIAARLLQLVGKG